MEGKDVIIDVRNAKKIYRMGQERIHAVDGISFTVNRGEFCCLLGTSGSGKSTLLNLMAGIEKLTSGDVFIKGQSIKQMSENKLSKFRQENLGFVFQSYNLLGSMTALENVELPLVFKKMPSSKRRRMARGILKKVGLGDRMMHKPKERCYGGKGYPAYLDALTSPRVYKPAYPIERALEIISEGSGSQFDPKCVEAFMDSLPEVRVILNKYSGKTV